MQKRIFGIILVLALVVSLSFASAFWPFSSFKKEVTGNVALDEENGIYLVDDNQTGFSITGANYTYFKNIEGYYDSDGYYLEPFSSGVASWTFSGVKPGSYNVYVSYFAKSNRPTNAVYKVSSSTVSFKDVNVNQRVAPSDMVKGGKTFKKLGRYYVSSGSLVVSVNGNTEGYLIVDSVRIDKVCSDNSSMLGDMNGDDVINNQDISAFTLAATNRENYSVNYPCLDAEIRGDINKDGVFNNQDISAFTVFVVNATTWVNNTCIYTYSDWGTCLGNIRNRTVASSVPAGCTGTPILSESCDNATATCTDSDGGLNYYVKGLVDYRSSSGYSTNASDKCLNNDVLAEYSCANFSSSYFSPYSEYTCPSGCLNGACLVNATTNQTPAEIACGGCFDNNKCYQIGYRKSGSYCAESGKFVSQLKENIVCENNFECSSNACLSGKCISSSLLNRVLEWFASWFR